MNLAGVVFVIAVVSLVFAGGAGAATTHAAAPGGAGLFSFTGHTTGPTSPTSGKSNTDITGWTEGQNNSGDVAVVGVRCLPFIFGLFNCAVAVPGANATISWGDGQGSPASLSFDPNCNLPLTGNSVCVITVSGSHTYAEEGIYNLTTVVNTGLGPALGASNLDVADAPLTTGSASAITGTEGTPVTVSGTFGDTYGGAPLSDYTALINWGDGSTSPGSISGSGGSYTVTGSHTYEASPPGGWPIQISAADIGGASVPSLITTTANIADAGLHTVAKNLTTTEGPFSGAVATFTDGNTGAAVSDFTALITWGDGATSPGTISGSGGNYTVSGSHTYEDGSYPLSVAISDIDGATTSMSATANVADAALTGTAQSISAFSTVPFSGVVATFTDANPAGKLSDYTASIKWGDGTTSPGTVAANPTGGWQVTGGHTFAAPGTYPVSVLVSDVGGKTTTVPDAAAVGSPPSPVTSITPSSAPNGNNGWYRSPVQLTVVANGLGLAVAQTRCVADPATAPAGFGALPASCPYTGAGGTLAGDGVHHIYAASANSLGNQEAPEVATFNIDTTPPSLACGNRPSFVLGSSGGSVPATVTDATSGPASSTVSGPAVLSSPGIHYVNLTGYDNAGNSATISCPYRVLGHINNLMNWAFLPGAKFSKVVSMFALDVPIGSQIKVICSHAKGCPFKAKTITASSNSKCKGKACKKHRKPNSVNVDLTSMFGKSHLPNGSQLLVEITKQFEIGKVWILSVRRNSQPASTITCMAPGGTTPGQGC